MAGLTTAQKLRLAYLSPYLWLAWKGKSRPWFRSGSREESNRTQGVILLSGLVSWPAGLLIFGLTRGQNSDKPQTWIAALPMALLIIVHFSVIRRNRSRELVREFASLRKSERTRVLLASLASYAAYLIASTTIIRWFLPPAG